jgi:cysteinyl-tRNA synthetase
MSLKFYNTLTKQKEEFIPIESGKVKIYSCGPTVYNYAHLGNLRAYLFTDLLRKTLKYFDYEVNQIMNITDIGHLSSDADEGEDKMTKALVREGKELNLKNMRELAEFYAQKFKEDIEALNIELADGFYFASDFIQEDIDLIKKLENKGFTYQTSDGIYFNTEKMPDYGILWGNKRNTEEAEGRIENNLEKINPKDFALWKFNKSLGFPSPWGQGFPGWHIECSAMSMKFLGEQLDIHTGGIDHVSIHHTNEIAQSECATGKKPFVKYWMHNEYLDISGGKMAKSGDNFFTLKSLVEKKIDPLAFRFLLLMASYRTKVNFNWEALEGAQIALKRFYRLYLELGEATGEINKEYQEKFTAFLADDLDTPKALVLVWDLIKDESLSLADRKATLLDFDKVLGLGLENLKIEIIPTEVLSLAEEREIARKNKDWQKADEVRKQINLLGYEIKDSDSGFEIIKI